MDMWRLIWGRLSLRQLAKVAPVAKSWRDGGVELASKRREAAWAGVTAPDHVPDCELSTLQRILRVMRRHLLGQDALTGELLQNPYEGSWRRRLCTPTEAERGVDPLVLEEFKSVTLKQCRLCVWDESSGLSISMSTVWEVPVSLDDPCKTSRLRGVYLWLAPGCPEDCEWMRGLLLALSDGSLGELCPSGYCRGAHPLVRGLLASCHTWLKVVWVGNLHESELLVLLPMFHQVQWERRYGDATAELKWDLRSAPASR